MVYPNIPITFQIPKLPNKSVNNHPTTQEFMRIPTPGDLTLKVVYYILRPSYWKFGAYIHTFIHTYACIFLKIDE